MNLQWGLRGKSALALVLACLLALLLAGFLGWQASESFKRYFGTAYARNLTLLSKQKILAPIARELALSERLAASEVTREWLLDEADPLKRGRFWREMAGYQSAFVDHSYFVISDISRAYYFNDSKSPNSEAARYLLKEDDPQSRWYFDSLRNTETFNINVDPDLKLKLTKVWFNVIVRDGTRKIGLAGTGIDLSSFLSGFVDSHETGVTPMILDRNAAIQAHPNRDLIAYNTGTQTAAAEKTLLPHLGEDASLLRKAMSAAEDQPDEVQILSAHLDGKLQTLAVAYIPQLKWHVLTAVDLSAAKVLEPRLFGEIVFAGLVLLVVLVLGFLLVLQRLVLNPLTLLTDSARTMAAGNYEVALPPASRDEIGELTRAFGQMADTVRTHTEDLESKVRERTGALSAANAQMAAANKKIGDSIEYASLIQRALLPDRQLAQSLGANQFVFWRPRDVVGGDFYVCRELAGGYLLGVVDCAGHGVPGAIMTMLAQAAIHGVLADADPRDPATLLVRTDAAVRAMLDEAANPRIATSMDAGFVFVDRAQARLVFAGAKVSLFCAQDGEVAEIKGDRRALADRRRGEYTNHLVALAPGAVCTLTTDGFLDQAGGDRGFGFGASRFAEMLRRHAGVSLPEQAEAFQVELQAYQGDYPQRDDITVLSFRFD